ncbi:hypothetical protein KDA_44370 [Dictyobacter alpinus]|uniref:Phosphoglycerate mutase n=1 Tax=Dictyobacter alpinus TaxID=2014873 RepID=A0A402BC43_9CHLR|nr:histidine phosphatase family protein [Dictyobacter alpinus]GCE28953.1 hypothetical protein KDA_44370 [Dictyobacter alpinus]
MQVYLVRHGEMGKRSGDDYLTLYGEEQARATGRYLADLPVTALLSSPLVRALGTAHLIAQEMGNRHIEVWPELREGVFREMTSYGKQALLADYPLALLPEDMGEQSCYYPADTQESLRQRARQVVRRLEEGFGESDTVVVVCHGGIISYIFHALLQMPAQSFSFFKVEFASISQVSLIPPQRRKGFPPLYPERAVDVVSVNDTMHLAELERDAYPTQER